MRPGQGFFVFLFFLGIFRQTLPAWESCSWNGEAAWQEKAGPWRAVVSQVRARLVYLGPAQSDVNLLTAPDSTARGAWGGHRFWLGPQTEWPSFWPPPQDWEMSAAQKIRVRHRELILTESHTDTGLPELTRHYQWQGRRLLLRTDWLPTVRDWQGVHIVQVPALAVIEVVTQKSTSLPHGYAELPMNGRPGFHTQFDTANTVLFDHNRLTLRHTGVEEKIGVPAAVLTVRENKYGFRLSPSTYQGKKTGSTDDAEVLTQIYVGDNLNPYLEVEQLTPRLRAPASATITLEPFESGEAGSKKLR